MAEPAPEFPCICVYRFNRRKQVAYVARSDFELHEGSVNSQLRGTRRTQYAVDSQGRRFRFRDVRVAGLDYFRIREIGVGISVLGAILSGVDFPLMLTYRLQDDGNMTLDELRDAVVRCVKDDPRPYTWRIATGEVLSRIERANTYAQLADAISR